MKKTIPKRLQPVLWSSSIESLDVERDKAYIIHQLFSHGRMEDMLWLFETYPKDELKEIFADHPYKDYDAARFNFVKKYLLGLNERDLNEKRYVKNTPRDLGQ